MNVVLANHTRSGARLRLEKKSVFGGRHLTAWNGWGNWWEVWGHGGGSPGQDLQIKIKSLFLFFFFLGLHYLYLQWEGPRQNPAKQKAHYLFSTARQYCTSVTVKSSSVSHDLFSFTWIWILAWIRSIHAQNSIPLNLWALTPPTAS